MDAIGVMDMRHEETDDVRRVRRVPSLQLVGTPERSTLDLNALRALGVRIVGRLAGLHETKAQFSGSLANQCTLADLKMNRLLDNIDDWIIENGRDSEVEPARRFDKTKVDAEPQLGMGLARDGIKTVLWATGYRPDYSWLHVPVLDRKGRIRHDGGVVDDALGLYVMGLPYLRRRKSSFIAGADDDARDRADHLCTTLHRSAA